MKTLSNKFKPANGYTTDFIKEQIVPKLNQRLAVIEQATEDEIALAISSFFAHGQTSYIVDCSVNPLYEEIRDKLVEYGHLRPDSTVKDVFRVSLPHSRLGFVTVDADLNSPKVETVYNTKYLDGSYHEVDRDYIRLVEGYPAVTWKAISPDLQVAYLTGQQDQPTRHYISLDKEKLANTFLKADREELLAIHDKIIDTATATDGVWRYQAGLISYNLSQIEKAVRFATIQVAEKADFKFLAEIKKNNRQDEIETLESVGGVV